MHIVFDASTNYTYWASEEPPSVGLRKKISIIIYKVFLLNFSFFGIAKLLLKRNCKNIFLDLNVTKCKKNMNFDSFPFFSFSFPAKII